MSSIPSMRPGSRRSRRRRLLAERLETRRLLSASPLDPNGELLMLAAANQRASTHTAARTTAIDLSKARMVINTVPTCQPSLQFQQVMPITNHCSEIEAGVFRPTGVTYKNTSDQTIFDPYFLVTRLDGASYGPKDAKGVSGYQLVETNLNYLEVGPGGSDTTVAPEAIQRVIGGTGTRIPISAGGDYKLSPGEEFQHLFEIQMLEDQPQESFDFQVGVFADVMLDLDIDSNNDGTVNHADDPTEDLPWNDPAVGPYLGVNADDDNDDLIQDRFTTDKIDGVSDVNDLLPSLLAANTAGLTNAKVQLQAVSGVNKVRLFDTSNGVENATVIKLNGAGTTFAIDDLPTSMRLEGIKPSTVKRDIRLKATLFVNDRRVLTDTVSVTTAEADSIFDKHYNGYTAPDRNNSIDFVTLMRSNDRVSHVFDLEAFERRNAFGLQVEDITRTAGEVQLVLRSFDTTGAEVDSIVGYGGGRDIPRTAKGLYQAGPFWVVFDQNLDNGADTLRGVPGGKLRIEYNDNGKVPRTVTRDFFIIDVSLQGSSTVPEYSDTPALPVVFENNEVDGTPSIAADLADFNGDQSWRVEIVDPRNPQDAVIDLESKKGTTNVRQDVVTSPGVPGSQYRLPRAATNVLRSGDLWTVQALNTGRDNPALEDPHVTLSALPGNNDRVRATYKVQPVGGFGMHGGPIETTHIRDVAAVSVDFDGVQGFNSTADVKNFDLPAGSVAGTETVGFGFDERVRVIGGGPVQATITTSSADIDANGPIDDNNFSQVNVKPADTTIRYQILDDSIVSVSPTSHTGSQQIDLDGDPFPALAFEDATRLHARLDDQNGMIMATLGARIVDPTEPIDVGFFVVDTTDTSQNPPVLMQAHTRDHHVPDLLAAANRIWAQNGIRFENVLTETLNWGGDVDSPPGNFPNDPGDVDLNGDTKIQNIQTMGEVDVDDRETLRLIAQKRLQADGHSREAISVIFVHTMTLAGQTGYLGLTAGPRVVIADSGTQLQRENTLAHELGHSMGVPGDGIDGDFYGVPGDDDGKHNDPLSDDDPETDFDESRQTELMHAESAPAPRDLSVDTARIARTGAQARWQLIKDNPRWSPEVSVMASSQPGESAWSNGNEYLLRDNLWATFDAGDEVSSILWAVESPDFVAESRPGAPPAGLPATSLADTTGSTRVTDGLLELTSQLCDESLVELLSADRLV